MPQLRKRISLNTAHLLVFGSVLAAALLILANLIASHEMKLRRLAEAKLQEAVGQQKELTQEGPVSRTGKERVSGRHEP